MLEDPFAVVHGVDEESRTDPSYRYDNANRGGINLLVIQRTFAGEGFFEDSHGRQRVPEGFAMVFTHREPTRYGYPEQGRKTYRHRYLSVTPVPGLREVFARLRTDFGSVLRIPLTSEAATHFDEVFDRFRARSFRDRLHESELFYRLLIALYREQVHGTQRSDPVEYGFHLLRDHFRSPMNLKSVAEKCGVSREHFIREFGSRYEESPGAMLRRLRLEYAQGMLAATELTVEDIALASGFASGNSFCRAFRERFGRSPGSRRKTVRTRSASAAD